MLQALAERGGSIFPAQESSLLDQSQRFGEGRGAVNYFRFIIQVSKGLIRDHRMRRTLMFYDVLGVLILLFLGSTLFWQWLREHPVFFLGYWAACGWLTTLAACLAIYDLIILRVEARRERRRLKKEMLEEDSDSSHDSHTG